MKSKKKKLFFQLLGAGGGIVGFNISGASVETLSKSGAGNEAHSIRSPEIFEYDSSTWGMLYMQRATASAGGRKAIALATSPKNDPHNWTKQGAIISQGTSGDWDYEPADATIYKEGSTWYVFYSSASSGKIGLASGSNLLSLTKHASNPLIDNTADTGAFNAISRHVNFGGKIGSTYYLFYEARVGPSPEDFETGDVTYATSTDLINWTLSDTKVIDLSLYPNTFTIKTSMPSIYKIGSTYFMFILMSDPSNNEAFGRGGGLGYATSIDLINWTLVTSDMWMMYLRAQCADWDTVRQEPSIMKNGSNYLLYYSGGEDIGYVELSNSIFDNTLPAALLSDNFTDNSFDTGLWTKAEANGKTVTETAGILKIVSDGSQNSASSKVFESNSSFAWNDYPSWSLGFIWMGVGLSTASREFGFLNAARTYGWKVLTSNTSQSVTLRLLTNGTPTDVTFTLTIGDRIKFVKNQCNVSIWLYRGGEWSRKVTITNAATWAGQSFNVQASIQNVSGDPCELDIDEIVLYPFDHNLKSVYDLTGTTLTIGIRVAFALDETSGNAIDAVGGVNGAVVGATQGVAGKLGTAYSFNGTSNYINLDSLLSELFTHTIGSIELWCKPTNGTPAAVTRIFTLGDADANNFFIISNATSGKCTIGLKVTAGGDWVATSDNVVFASNTWTHVILTHNGTTPILYINGGLSAITFTTSTNKNKWLSTMSALADKCRIGSLNFNSGGESGFYSGVIDEVRVWNRELTLGEVGELYNDGNGKAHPFT